MKIFFVFLLRFYIICIIYIGIVLIYIHVHIIRILDYLAEQDVDVDSVIQEKMKYNETRPYRHGGKEL